MSVIFKVECSETLPGDAVFVVGNSEALGDFNPSKALPLATNESEFPLWTSKSVVLPPGSDVQYKFLIQKEDLSGAASWETLQETNRTVRATPGMLTTARTSWGKCHADLSARFDESLARAAKERQDEENAMLKEAESHTGDAEAQARSSDSVASSLMARTPMRRNFSQSLIMGDDSGDDDETEEGEETPQRQPSPDLTPSMRKSVPLKNITSFSALSLMAEAAEKDEARMNHRAKPQYDPTHLDVPVVVVTSEFAPWSKTGGLGLVAASYSYEFPKSGHRTMIIAPKYKHYDGISYVGETDVLVQGRQERVKYYHLVSDSGCDCVFVEHPSIERGGGLYSDANGLEYSDNLFRFTLLSLAALEAPFKLKLNGSVYGERVVFLANDWQAGLVPLYMCHKYRRNGVYKQARVLYVVHNLGYQGSYHGVNACDFFCVDQQAANDLAFGNTVNLSKGALVCADRVLTVSPNYAREIQTPLNGFGLHDFVRAKASSGRVVGILNGIDDAWNPQTDKKIFANYSVENFLEGKRKNKGALQASLQLEPNPTCVLIGFTGRLTWQKGVDVLGSIISWLMEDTGNGVTGNCQLIMMGNGERQYSDVLKWAEHTYPGKVCGYVGFDPEVEHKVMAGCDLFLMPSRYEPCGLPQMCSQLYGTLPIVTDTGGLHDSVKDVSAGYNVATGFHIPHLEQGKVKEVVYKAAELFVKQPEDFQAMQTNAMMEDFYWTRAIDEYEKQLDVTLSDAEAIR